jgi:hypothetical protein
MTFWLRNNVNPATFALRQALLFRQAAGALCHTLLGIGRSGPALGRAGIQATVIYSLQTRFEYEVRGGRAQLSL